MKKLLITLVNAALLALPLTGLTPSAFAQQAVQGQPAKKAAKAKTKKRTSGKKTAPRNQGNTKGKQAPKKYKYN